MTRLSSKLTSPLAVGVLAIGALATFVSCQRAGSSGVAPTPAVFNEAMTLDAAMAQADREGKVVVAVTTADWCPPCQVYKRSALVDREVVSWIEANAVPVYIDADADRESAQTLGVQSLPTTTVLRDGEVIASEVGNVDAAQLLATLRSAG